MADAINAALNANGTAIAMLRQTGTKQGVAGMPACILKGFVKHRRAFR
jgi:hypothetical protein